MEITLRSVVCFTINADAPIDASGPRLVSYKIARSYSVKPEPIHPIGFLIDLIA